MNLNRTRQAYVRQDMHTWRVFCFWQPAVKAIALMLPIFNKPSLTIPAQIAHLRLNGMIIEDDQLAAYWLTHVSYYRLSAYWLAFENPKGSGLGRFRDGTTLEHVLELYAFDRDLRRLVMRGLEHFEVALRGSWAYQLAQCGAHAYLDDIHYQIADEHKASVKKLENAVRMSSETYIEHYRNTYGEPHLPPVWMVAEMMSFGQLSRWYSNLSNRALRNRIAEPLGLPETVLVPLVRHVTDIRNICAHHGRLWNRGFLQPPKLAQKPHDLNTSLNLDGVQAPAQLYNALTMVAHVIRTVAPASSWAKDLSAHIQRHPFGGTAAMGFPADWAERALWK